MNTLGPDPAVMAAIEKGNKVVFFDIEMGEIGKSTPLGRIKMELFVKESHQRFHDTRRDFLNHDGTGKTSIYNSAPFPDENFLYKHDTAGLLSMANSGPNTNGCQFFITCQKCDWLDGKHCVFGKVLDDASMLVVRKCEAVPVSGSKGKPRLTLRITESGEL